MVVAPRVAAVVESFEPSGRLSEGTGGGSENSKFPTKKAL